MPVLVDFAEKRSAAILKIMNSPQKHSSAGSFGSQKVSSKKTYLLGTNQKVVLKCNNKEWTTVIPPKKIHSSLKGQNYPSISQFLTFQTQKKTELLLIYPIYKFFLCIPAFNQRVDIGLTLSPLY